MNCDECKSLISVFMDNELDECLASGVRFHLADCMDCAKVCEDFAAILDFCKADTVAEAAPPNSQALWCRINNIIENEVQPPEAPVVETKRRWFWSASVPQLAAASLCIAVLSSVVTVFGVQRYYRSAEENGSAIDSGNQTTIERVLSKVGLIDTPQQAREKRIMRQMAAIEYWDQRVQARRVQWDRNMRDAFDRNLNAIDETVSEYTLILQRDPMDDLSGEMLDSALEEKMKLLRDFADL